MTRATNLLKSPTFLILAAAWLFLAAAQAAETSPGGFVTVSGKNFMDPSGSVLHLRGTSLGDWLQPEGYMMRVAPEGSARTINEVLSELVGEDAVNDFWKTYRDTYITRDDIQFIAKAGFNAVRIPFDYRLFVRNGPYSDNFPVVFEGPGYALMDRVLGWCKEAHLYAILDMHAAPGGQTGFNIDNSWGYPFLWDSPECQSLTIAIWKHLAQRYSADPTVLGYDLLNEPIGFNPKGWNPKLEPLYKRIVAAIRTVDKNHIAILGGSTWDIDFSVFGPPFDSKLAYTFHLYSTKPAKIQQYLDFRDKYNVPLWLGESGENTDAWIAGFRQLLEKNNIGWSFWPYKKLEPAPEKDYKPGSCVVTIPTPEGWEDQVMGFAEFPRTSWAELRATKRPTDVVQKLMTQFLVNIQFKNCHVNEGYLAALGLKTTSADSSTAPAEKTDPSLQSQR